MIKKICTIRMIGFIAAKQHATSPYLLFYHAYHVPFLEEITQLLTRHFDPKLINISNIHQPGIVQSRELSLRPKNRLFNAFGYKSQL